MSDLSRAANVAGAPPGHTAVLDIGKTHAKLLLIDPDGELLRSDGLDNRPQPDAVQGTLALGVARLAAWIERAAPALWRGVVPTRWSIATHGAAFCALGDHGLVLPPIDYEWDGYGSACAGFEDSLDDFAHHGTPRLPLGLNAGRQIEWVRRRWPELDAQIRCWLPYPQFWAWWLTGLTSNEASSLGCHTGLWAPRLARFSDWAVAAGLPQRFAPLRRAWEPLGPLRPALATAWGLPQDAPRPQVLVGAHDSNACLARHLHTHARATVISSGTWTVVMAPGAEPALLEAGRDELVNVAVDGRPVPTARFMGGREFARLSAGTDPAAATETALAEVLAQGWMALPAFADEGGPHRGRRGSIWRDGRPLDAGIAAVPAALRPALASLYVAQMAAALVQRLAGPSTDGAPVILEGPMAHNAALCTALQAALALALPPRPLLRSLDPLEGTARGAWQLARWHDPSSAPAALPVAPVQDPLRAALWGHTRAWRQALTGWDESAAQDLR